MDKAIFHGEIVKMMNKDSNWSGSGNNRTFTEYEMKTFIEHLWDYFNEKAGSIDELALTYALLKTEHIVSAQDRAAVIQKKLKI